MGTIITGVIVALLSWFLIAEYLDIKKGKSGKKEFRRYSKFGLRFNIMRLFGLCCDAYLWYIYRRSKREKMTLLKCLEGLERVISGMLAGILLFMLAAWEFLQSIWGAMIWRKT